MDVVCIGSGNVATHVAQAFKTSGANVIQVWSPNSKHAEKLALLVGAQSVSELKTISKNADLYVIAVKDDAIATVCAQLTGIGEGLVVHTSGATSIQTLSSFNSYGVLYPLQTFSLNRPIDFKDVPLCIEAKDVLVLEKLRNIASGLSQSVYDVDSDKRKTLHLAAVFACNFVNHLYELGNQVLINHQLDFEMLRPLIIETAMKVQHENPVNVQTGPAVRDDEQTMAAHLKLISDKPDLIEIYQTLSKSIKKTHS